MESSYRHDLPLGNATQSYQLRPRGGHDLLRDWNQSSKVESIMHAGHVTLIGRVSGIPNAELQWGQTMAWVALV